MLMEKLKGKIEETVGFSKGAEMNQTNSAIAENIIIVLTLTATLLLLPVILLGLILLSRLVKNDEELPKANIK
jgi:hypothetical protein